MRDLGLLSPGRIHRRESLPAKETVLNPGDETSSLDHHRLGQMPWLIIGLVAAAILVAVLWRTLGDREP